MIERFYNKCPKFIKKNLKHMLNYIPYELRLGKTFKEAYKLCIEAQWWPAEKHMLYQFAQLKSLLTHAYNNVPYYNETFKSIGFEPEDFTDFSILKKLPYLTRDIIIQSADKLIAKNYAPGRYVKVTTGGTTGLPMYFYEDRLAFHREWGFIAGIWSTFNYEIYKPNRSVILRGDSTRNSFFFYRGNDLILSSFQLLEKNMKEYLKLIGDFNPTYIKAYPSSISILSEYMLRNNIRLKLKNLRAIICSSEFILDSQRKTIEDAFNKKIYSHYGHSEKSCLGTECEISHYYHLISEYGYTEIINSSGLDVSGEDELGEIVCTGFNNYVMPFIRYRTSDIAANTVTKCNCGRNYKLVKKIQGRIQDFFVDKSGCMISIIVSDKPLWKISHKLNAYQYVQNDPGKLILNIDSREPLSEKEILEIKHDFLKYYPNFNLHINETENIQRTKSGKFAYLIQNISNKFNFQL